MIHIYVINRDDSIGADIASEYGLDWDTVKTLGEEDGEETYHDGDYASAYGNDASDAYGMEGHDGEHNDYDSYGAGDYGMYAYVCLYMYLDM